MIDINQWYRKRLEDNPSYPSFGIRNQVYGNVLYNEVGVDSELTSFFGILILIVYKGVFVGYRGYEVKDLAPLFPFGYGISYTTFEYSNLQHSVDPEGIVLVSFTIKNTGRVAGREIAQVYLSDPVSTLPRPVKELKGFTKVALNPGESKSVTVKLDSQALCYFDEKKSCWLAEPGTFVVSVGASSADLRLKGEFVLEKGFSRTGL